MANKYWGQIQLLGDIVEALLTRVIAYRILSWATGTTVSGTKMYFMHIPVSVRMASVKETLFCDGWLT